MKQRTFKVGEEKITIKSRPSTYMRNMAGYIVWINGTRYQFSCLYQEEAEDKAYSRWVKEHSIL